MMTPYLLFYLTPIPEYPLGGKGVESALRSSLLFGYRQSQGVIIMGVEVCFTRQSVFGYSRIWEGWNLLFYEAVVLFLFYVFWGMFTVWFERIISRQSDLRNIVFLLKWTTFFFFFFFSSGQARPVAGIWEPSVARKAEWIGPAKE